MTNATYIKAFVTARTEGMSELGAEGFASHCADHGGWRDSESLLEAFDRYVAGLDRLNFLLSMVAGKSA